MQKRRVKKRRLKWNRSDRDRTRDEHPKPAPSASKRLSAFYAAGPVIRLGTMQQPAENQHEREDNTGAEGENIQQVRSVGIPHRSTAYNTGDSLRLRGRTDYEFNGGSFKTRNVRVRRASSCENCPDDECVRVTGRLVTRYRVRTSVTLPNVNDYPDLIPCQRRRVRDAINNTLAPHEQEHVTALRTYNGTTRHRFDLTLCRNEFDRTIRSRVETEERSRRAAAEAASNALDPFHVDVDLDC